MTDLRPLIEMVKAEEHPFVVIFLEDDAIRWQAESEFACCLMAKAVKAECRVMPRMEFLAMLEKAQAEEENDARLPS